MTLTEERTEKQKTASLMIGRNNVQGEQKTHGLKKSHELKKGMIFVLDSQQNP